MPYTKTVVCLANSRKHEGFCFAGKEVLSESYGGWIRPVSVRKHEEISKIEQTFSNGDRPEILDVVTIPMLEHKPVYHQQENHLIDDSQRWKRAGSVNKDALPELLDDTPGELWINTEGNNDRIPVSAAKRLKGSLLLIKPESLTIVAQWKQPYQGGPPQVRAIFDHNAHNYNLTVTDLIAEEKYRQKSRGYEIPCEHPVAVDSVYLCVSLTEKEFHGDFYKLVAAIIGDET